MFDTNGHTPISEDVDDIFSTFNLCGIKIWAGNSYFINLERKNLKEICKELSVSEEKIAEIAREMNKLIEGERK